MALALVVFDGSALASGLATGGPSETLATATDSGTPCRIQALGAILATDGDVLGEDSVSKVFTYLTEDWQACYEKASEFATLNPTTSDATAGLKILGFEVGRQVKTTAQIFWSWSFDDGYLRDSSGSVTAFTKNHVHGPTRGDERYKADGSKY